MFSVLTLKRNPQYAFNYYGMPTAPSEDLSGIHMLTPQASSPVLRKAGPHHIRVQSKIIMNLYKPAASVAGMQASRYSKSSPILLHVYHLSLHSYSFLGNQKSEYKNVYEWVNHLETSIPA